MDRTGASASTTILILLVVVLLLWQFVLPLWDIPSLTDSLGATEETPDVINSSYYLYNSVLDEICPVNDTVHDLDPTASRVPGYYPAYDINDNDEIPDYQIIFTTNAPAKILDPYSLVITSVVYEWSGGTRSFVLMDKSIGAFSGTGDKTITYQFEAYKIDQIFSSYTDIHIQLIDPNGNREFSEHLVII